jgi:hypothetical protein
MARRKPQVIYSVSGESLEEAKSKVRLKIDDLLWFANNVNSSEALDRVTPGASQFAIAANRLLTAMLSGHREEFTDWPAWAVEAALNINSNLNSGSYRLARCARCGNWMLVKTVGRERQVCVRGNCRRALKADAKRSERQALVALSRGALKRAQDTF